LNYFNYFTEVEDAFVRRRGKHLLLSSMDWALIESWKEMDVPLHVVLRGIEKSFDSWESKPRKRSVKTLLYCQEEVEAQFAEWRESRIGAASEQDQNGVQPNREGLPFSAAAIVGHLQLGRIGLLAALANNSRMKESLDDDFSEALERAVARLTELEQEVAEVALLDAQKLEQSLTGVERMLSDAVRLVASAEDLETIKREVKDQLKPYRKQMEPAVYQQTLDNLLLKRLREQFGIPRLSLFYL
jgi:Asp-tRNA(Asn)/Glu-tRNA(Gln) amidotransferase A subunit family amidase